MTILHVASAVKGRAFGRMGLKGGVGLTFGTSLLIQVMNTLTGILTARLLGPEGKGLLATVVLWPSLIASLGNLGVSDAITYFTARDGRQSGSIMRAAARLAVPQIAVLMLIGLLTARVVLAPKGSNILTAGLLFTAYIPLALLIGYRTALLGGLLQFGRLNVVRLTVVALTLLGQVVLWRFSAFTVEHALAVIFVANIGTLLVTVLLVRAARQGAALDAVAAAPPLLAYGVRSHTANLATTLTDRLDQTLISVFLPPSALGLYVVAGTFSAATGLISGAFSTVSLPLVAGAVDDHARGEALSRVMRLTLLLSFATAAVLLPLAPLLLRLFFGAAFVPATATMRVLLLASVVVGAARVLLQGLRAFGRPLAAGAVGGVGSAITVITLALLLPRYGILGAALASLASASCTLSIGLWYAQSELGIDARRQVVPLWRDVRDLVDVGRDLLHKTADALAVR